MRTTNGIHIIDIEWDRARNLDLNWKQGLVVNRAARSRVGKIGLESLLRARPTEKPRDSVSLFRFAREDQRWYPAPGSGVTAFKKEKGKVLAYTWIPKTKHPKYTVRTTTQLQAVGEDILYVDRKRHELYMEVLVASPDSSMELYRVSKRILASVNFACASCGAVAWRLERESVVRRVEGRKRFSCFRLHFICSHCNTSRIVAGATIRSLLDRLGRTLKQAFERLEEVEVGKNGIKVKLGKGQHILERC